MEKGRRKLDGCLDPLRWAGSRAASYMPPGGRGMGPGKEGAVIGLPGGRRGRRWMIWSSLGSTMPDVGQARGGLASPGRGVEERCHGAEWGGEQRRRAAKNGAPQQSSGGEWRVGESYFHEVSPQQLSKSPASPVQVQLAPAAPYDPTTAGSCCRKKRVGKGFYRPDDQNGGRRSEGDKA